jgi:hypothetical protein
MNHDWIWFDESLIRSEREQNINQRQRLLLIYLHKTLILKEEGKAVPIELAKMVEMLVCSETNTRIVTGQCMVCGKQEAIVLS